MRAAAQVRTRTRLRRTCSTAAAPALVERVIDAPAWTALKGWVGLPGYVRQSWGPGWALVGDAGYFKDPITTHGMTDGLRDAELLGDRILDVLGGGAEAVALRGVPAHPGPAVDEPVRRHRGGGALRLGLRRRRARCCAR